MEDDSPSSREQIVPKSNSTSLASFFIYIYKTCTCGAHAPATVPGIEMREFICVPRRTIVVTSRGPAKLWEWLFSSGKRKDIDVSSFCWLGRLQEQAELK